MYKNPCRGNLFDRKATITPLWGDTAGVNFSRMNNSNLSATPQSPCLGQPALSGMKKFWATPLLALLALCFALAGCVTQKKKGEDVGWFRRGYHNLTTKYNYWFNADELFRLTTAKLNEQHSDNYNHLLEVYPYMAVDPQSAKSDLDNVIKKSSTGIALHRVGGWTDDCYLLIGQSQFVKHDFETAEATFKFFKEEYNPNKKTKSKFKKSSKKKKQSAKNKKKSSSKKKKKKSSSKKKKKKSSKKKSSSKGKVTAADKKAGDKASTAPTDPKADPKKASKKAEDELVLTGDNPYKKNLTRTHAYPEAMIWYGRTLTEREKYDEADFLFRDLEEDPWFPPSLRDDLAVAEANLWIKQKKYDRAIPSLSRAIQLTQKKKQRARLAFVLAQLYDEAGREDEAYAAYETVLRSRPVYVMEFNARLRQVQAGWANGKLSSAEANRSLDRMLKDEKNKEYRDRIYYTLAEIALKDGQKPEAIVFLRKSLDANSGDVVQRAESYLKLADLYFEGEDFVNAKSYYDSTLTVLPATDGRHARATAYAANLTDIARLITTIAANDSIVRVYRMSDDERKDLAKLIKKKREAEAEAAAKAEAEKAQSASAAPSGPKSAGPQAGQKTSSFYFYSESLVKKGRKDFSKNWGDRKLEDNWRRSLRPKTDTGDDVAATDSTRANQVSDTDLKNIFQGLPGSEAELSVLHLATYEAMYQLGTLFRDKLQNNRRCSGTLEEMQTRYPDTTKYEKETWYYCYLAFTDLSNPVRAKYYLDKLVEKYPNSTYARALTDPNFVAAGKEREREMNKYYEQTYSLFTNGGYKDAFERCQEAPKKYGSQNALMPKFVLLSALCVGNLQGSDEYCKALSEVSARYPESAEATRAKEISRLLACKGFEVPKADDKPKTEIDDAFTREDDKLHYFIVALKGDDIRLDDVKAAISDYNREFHKLEQLRISNIFLGTSTDEPMVVIRKFDNKDQTMRYFNEVKGRKEFLGEGKKAYKKEFFAVTQENYRRILKNKTLDGYREFFEENYLK